MRSQIEIEPNGICCDLEFYWIWHNLVFTSGCIEEVQSLDNLEERKPGVYNNIMSMYCFHWIFSMQRKVKMKFNSFKLFFLLHKLHILKYVHIADGIFSLFKVLISPIHDFLASTVLQMAMSQLLIFLIGFQYSWCYLYSCLVW